MLFKIKTANYLHSQSAGAVTAGWRHSTRPGAPRKNVLPQDQFSRDWAPRLERALCSVRLSCDQGEGFQECRRLADKMSRICQGIHHTDGKSLGIGGPNDGAERQFRADEFGGNTEDQVGLQSWVHRNIKVRESKAVGGIGERGDWRLHAIAREVYPLQEVHDFVSANAEQNLQDLSIGGLLGQDRVEAGSGLLNHSEVKSRRVGNCLDVIFGGEIIVVSWNGWHVHQVDGLRESGAKVGILGAAITSKPAGIHGEVHDVGEPPDLLRAFCLTAGQSSEGIEIHRLGADRKQKSIQKFRMAGFVDRVAGDVLRAIGIELHEGRLISVHGFERGSLHGKLAWGKTTQLRVLLPQVSFNELGRSGETEKGDVSRRDGGSLGRLRDSGNAARQDAGSGSSCSAGDDGAFQK